MPFLQVACKNPLRCGCILTTPYFVAKSTHDNMERVLSACRPVELTCPVCSHTADYSRKDFRIPTLEDMPKLGANRKPKFAPGLFRRGPSINCMKCGEQMTNGGVILTPANGREEYRVHPGACALSVRKNLKGDVLVREITNADLEPHKTVYDKFVKIIRSTRPTK
jgi:hypothetical protein